MDKEIVEKNIEELRKRIEALGKLYTGMDSAIEFGAWEDELKTIWGISLLATTPAFQELKTRLQGRIDTINGELATSRKLTELERFNRMDRRELYKEIIDPVATYQERLLHITKVVTDAEEHYNKNYKSN